MAAMGLDYRTFAWTGSMLSIEWSELGNVTDRKQRFGGAISHWGASRIGEWLYVVPASVTIESVDEALRNALGVADRAVLSYPHGSTERGASAMRLRFYGRAAGEAPESP